MRRLILPLVLLVNLSIAAQAANVMIAPMKNGTANVMIAPMKNGTAHRRRTDATFKYVYVGEGECRDVDGDYPVVFAKDFSLLRPWTTINNAETAKIQCKDLCTRYTWCAALTVVTRNDWPTPQCNLVTNRDLLLTAGVSLNACWGCYTSVAPGDSYQTYVGGGGTSVAKDGHAAVYPVHLYERAGYNCYQKYNDLAGSTFTIVIGSSDSNKKTIAFPHYDDLSCPSFVDKNNWHGAHDFPDQFSVSLSGSTVTVQRLDYSGGWGMVLSFECTAFPAAASDTACSKKIGGGGWTRVRHVPAGYTWHPAKDHLAGTESYGSPTVDSAPWSIKWDNTPVTEMLFATGDCAKWLVSTPDAVQGEIYTNQRRQILESSTSTNSYTAKWYNRGVPEDPWISLNNHDQAISQGNILYGGNSFGDQHAANVLPAHKGADVYVRGGKGTPVAVYVGSSHANTKTVTVAHHTVLSCPSIVDSGNYHGVHGFPDRFGVSVSGQDITVRRLDYNGGWGMDLYIECTVLVGRRTEALTLKRFVYGKSHGAANFKVAHQQQKSFCETKGGRLPTRDELCPNYVSTSASAPGLGCENSHSWVPYDGSENNWMYIGCPGTGHYMCKDHMTHHGAPVWASGDQYGDMVDCMVPALTLKRFVYGKSHGAANFRVAHQQQESFCESKGGRLPTRDELCPNYASSAASAPGLGCENSHSWVPYDGSEDNWMYIGCPGTGHHMCKDHVTHHGAPVWGSGDQYGDMVDCMVPDMPAEYHVVKSGNCESNGFDFIKTKAECSTAGRIVGMTFSVEDPTASGNRQRWCGTWSGLTWLHFNSQTSGQIGGYPVLQNAGKDVAGPADTWQICKTRGSVGRRLARGTLPKAPEPLPFERQED